MDVNKKQMAPVYGGLACIVLGVGYLYIDWGPPTGRWSSFMRPLYDAFGAQGFGLGWIGVGFVMWIRACWPYR
jgi:hypothetical protein